MSNTLEYFRYTLDNSVLDKILSPCYNLSAILGDTEGYIPRSTCKSALRDYTLIPPGVVVNTRIDLTKAFLESSFIGEVSSKSVEVHSKLLKNDPMIVLPSMTSYVVSDSPLLRYSHALGGLDRVWCNVLYIEALSIYGELKTSTLSSIMQGVTKFDLSRIDHNIRVVTQSLEYRNGKLPIELIHVLRDLQRTVAYVKRMDFLFLDSYSNQSNNYFSLKGVT